ncbi:MAG: hypothetical protein WC071_06930 [Victivallaceae bacterium]
MRKSMTLLRVICLPLLFSLSLHAMPRSGSSVTNSEITNTNEKVTVNASNNSDVNTGVQIRGSSVNNSQIDNRFSGTVQARNSNVNTGIKADDAYINNSSIKTDTRANIYARNATVNTGVNVSGANNANISTRVRAGSINASNSVVKVGAVEGGVDNKKISTDVNVGNVDAEGRNYSLGSVKVNDFPGGVPTVKSAGQSRAGASIGNVTVNSALVREVKTSVQSDDFIEALKVKHKAKVYKDKGGVDPTGTKNVFVEAKQREKVEAKGGSVGDSTINSSDYKVRKVKTFVE